MLWKTDSEIDIGIEKHPSKSSDDLLGDDPSGGNLLSQENPGMFMFNVWFYRKHSRF